MHSIARIAAASALSLVLARPAYAVEPVNRLTLEQAIALSLTSNPSLVADEALVRAARARADRSALAPPFTIGMELENVAGTGELSGIDSAETTLRVGRVIELGGKRAARQALGAAEVARQTHVGALSRLDVIHRTTSLFAEVVADQQRLALSRERIGLAERTRDEVASWVKAARNSEADLRGAEIELADAELEREHAEHELASAKVTLAAMWGAFEPDFTEVSGNLDRLPVTLVLEDLIAQLPASLDEKAALLEADSIEARRTLAESERSPDISVSLGVRRINGIDDQGLVMSASVPVGGRTRASFSSAEANAQLAAVDAVRTARRLESRQILFEKYQELTHARTEYDALTRSMIPKAEDALRIAQRGFEIGRTSFVYLAQAQRMHFNLRERAIDAAARFHFLHADIQRLAATAVEGAK